MQSVVGEVVVVLDHRTRDNTREIAEAFEGVGMIERVKVIRYEWNHHFGDARSASLRHCTGRYIIWLDCDERVVEEDLPALVAACEEERSMMFRATALVDATYDGPQHDIQGFGIGSMQPRPRVYRNYLTAHKPGEDDVEPTFVPIEAINDPYQSTAAQCGPESLVAGSPFRALGVPMVFDSRVKYRFRVHEGVTFPGGDFEITHELIDVRIEHVGSDNPYKNDYYYALQVIASRDDPQEAHYAIYLAGRICREGHAAEAMQVLDAADMRTISTKIQLERYWVVRGKILQSIGVTLQQIGTPEALRKATRYMRMAIDVFGEAGCSAGRLHAAVLLVDQGMNAVATEVLREALTLDPDHLQLKGMLGIAEAWMHSKAEVSRRMSYYLGTIGQGADPREASKQAMALDPLREDPNAPKALSDEDARAELMRRKASLKGEPGAGRAEGPSVVDRAIQRLSDRQGVRIDLDKLVGGKDGSSGEQGDGASDGDAASEEGEGTHGEGVTSSQSERG